MRNYAAELIICLVANVAIISAQYLRPRPVVIAKPVVVAPVVVPAPVARPVVVPVVAPRRRYIIEKDNNSNGNNIIQTTLDQNEESAEFRENQQILLLENNPEQILIAEPVQRAPQTIVEAATGAVLGNVVTGMPPNTIIPRYLQTREENNEGNDGDNISETAIAQEDAAKLLLSPEMIENELPDNVNVEVKVENMSKIIVDHLSVADRQLIEELDMHDLWRQAAEYLQYSPILADPRFLFVFKEGRSYCKPRDGMYPFLMFCYAPDCDTTWAKYCEVNLIDETSVSCAPQIGFEDFAMYCNHPNCNIMYPEICKLVK